MIASRKKLGALQEILGRPVFFRAILELVESDNQKALGNAVAQLLFLQNKDLKLVSRISVPTEVEETSNQMLLFRSDDSIHVSITCEFLRLQASKYLRAVVRPVLKKLMPASKPAASYEIEVHKLSEGENQAANLGRLLDLADGIVSAVISNQKQVPFALSCILHRIHRETEAKFPNRGLPLVRSMLFLRVVDPALISLKHYGVLTDERPYREPKRFRALVLCAKLLQNLANGHEEEFKASPAMEAFYQKHNQSLNTFCQELIKESTPSKVNVPDRHSSMQVECVNALVQFLQPHQARLNELVSGVVGQRFSSSSEDHLSSVGSHLSSASTSSMMSPMESPHLGTGMTRSASTASLQILVNNNSAVSSTQAAFQGSSSVPAASRSTANGAQDSSMRLSRTSFAATPDTCSSHGSSIGSARAPLTGSTDDDSSRKFSATSSVSSPGPSSDGGSGSDPATPTARRSPGPSPLGTPLSTPPRALVVPRPVQRSNLYDVTPTGSPRARFSDSDGKPEKIDRETGSRLCKGLQQLAGPLPSLEVLRELQQLLSECQVAGT